MKKTVKIALLLAVLSFVGSFTFSSGSRNPASMNALNTAPLWKDLYSSTRKLEKEFDRRTFDVSNLDDVDSTGEVRIRTEHELKVLAFREEMDRFQSYIKIEAKRIEKIGAGELENFFRTYAAKLEEWKKLPLIDELPSPAMQKLESTHASFVALVKAYQPSFEEPLLTPEFENLFAPREKEIKFRSANHACSLVSSPGNIILRKALLIDGNTDNDFSPHIMKMINLLESLKGGDNVLKYRHSELISQIQGRNNIETVSYYPWYFMMGKPKEDRKPMFMTMNNRNPEYFTYRSKYAVFRVKNKRFDLELDRRESALNHIENKFFFNRMGTCADFVNWTFSNAITSPWNQIPLIRHIIANLYMPEAMQTPDNLADSPETEKICEVEDSELVFPTSMNTQDWLNRTKVDLKSKHPAVRKHAEEVFQFFIKNGIISETGERLVDKIDLQLSQ